MQAIGFVISGKPGERRRAVLPRHLLSVRHRQMLFFEQDYAIHLGIPDECYTDLGCRVVPRREAYRCPVICNPKAPTDSEYSLYGRGRTLFGWLHAVQSFSLTAFLRDRAMTGIAWEDMDDSGQHVFWRNNEIAGEAAVLHAVPHLGRAPDRCRAALIGLGNCGRGAFKMLGKLGVEVVIFGPENVSLLPRRLSEFDLVVNAVKWDIFASGHLIARSDLRRMRRGSLIIDISCDERMGIESSRPTSVSDPVFEVEGVLHYAVDHTPTVMFRTATESISKALAPYLDEIVENKPGACLRRATVIEKGTVLDPRIIRFQRLNDPIPRRELSDAGACDAA
jgi:N5-(carboxyethyl)ornithine synthase